MTATRWTDALLDDMRNVADPRADDVRRVAHAVPYSALAQEELGSGRDRQHALRRGGHRRSGGSPDRLKGISTAGPRLIRVAQGPHNVSMRYTVSRSTRGRE
jgi:hypothetical protein